ncbi:MAG TPA: thiamine pyrophosphate-binding protein [Terriglobales bacterium]|jgi:acetolactate synthase-1/2/3 large subunit|nr:thiamine pyrophosphate-binding protein [Terriglobales bacterium]
MQLTVGQIIGKALKAYGVPYVAGLPGHGNWSMIDAFHDPVSRLPFLQVMHEQSAVHIADAHYRVTGQPIAAFTSIGPGATNTIIGLATAHCDSTALLLITGSAATHMRGHGVMQELDRFASPDFPHIAAPVTKRTFDVIRADQVPFVLHRAWNAMLTGRPGPVHMEVPLDVQVETTDIDVAEIAKRLPVGKTRADSQAIEAAIKLLLAAQRPCIVAGGGAVSANATPELTNLAEKLGIPVVFTWNGKGAIAEDNAMCAGTAGWPGSLSGNHTAANADVVMSLGCRFTDWSASSYRKGVTFSIPSAKLIQVDIDPREIGKNYPAEVGIAADCKLVLADILAGISGEQASRVRKARSSYLANVEALKQEWEKKLEHRRSYTSMPTTMLRTLRELRRVLPRHGIVTVGSGHPQSTTKQAFPVYEPRTHITSGSFSSMGFALPAAIGAKLAKPDTPVVCIIGDGDFMMCVQELAVCAMHDIPVVFLILNNSGYISIRDGQDHLMGRQIGSEFIHHSSDGRPYSVDFAALAKSFGFGVATKVQAVDDIGSSIKRALDSEAPALVEVPITRDASVAAAEVVGWWDFPVLPTASEEVKADYKAGYAAEQHRKSASDVELAEPLSATG